MKNLSVALLFLYMTGHSTIIECVSDVSVLQMADVSPELMEYLPPTEVSRLVIVLRMLESVVDDDEQMIIALLEILAKKLRLMMIKKKNRTNDRTSGLENQGENPSKNPDHLLVHEVTTTVSHDATDKSVIPESTRRDNANREEIISSIRDHEQNRVEQRVSDVTGKVSATRIDTEKHEVDQRPNALPSPVQRHSPEAPAPAPVPHSAHPQVVAAPVPVTMTGTPVQTTVFNSAHSG